MLRKQRKFVILSIPEPRGERNAQNDMISCFCVTSVNKTDLVKFGNIKHGIE
jgi:hypothetical protein